MYSKAVKLLSNVGPREYRFSASGVMYINVQNISLYTC